MLATILGVEFDVDESYNKRLDQWKLSDQIVKTRNITQTSIGRNGVWTTVVAAAILLPEIPQKIDDKTEDNQLEHSNHKV